MADSIIKVKYAACIFACFLIFLLPTKVFSEDLFPTEVTSHSWAAYGQCKSNEKRFFIFSGAFRGDEILCASTDSSQKGQAFHLFLECSVNGSLITYMGTAMYSGWYIEMDMTEYRGATGAPDIYLELEKCDTKMKFDGAKFV